VGRKGAKLGAIAVFITGHALITVGKGHWAQVMLTGGPGLRWR
jgi:hypothetical protein